MMKRLLSVVLVMGATIAVFAILGCSSAAANAPPTRTKSVPFTITADKRTSENRLIIPRKFLQIGGSESVGMLGNDDAGTNLRTIIAGLAISVSVISLVFLIIRKKSRGAQAAALFVAFGASGFLWIEQARADGLPATYDVVRQWSHVSESDQNVKIEIIEKGDAVELILGTKYRGSGGQPIPEPKDSPPVDGSAPPEEATKPE